MRIGFVVLGALFVAPAAHAAIAYHVGTGWPRPTPSDVPWESLGPGDSVYIHARATPYRDKWVICRVGTESAPIVVRGIPGAGGELPVIDGADAVMRPALNFWNEERGVIKIGGANNPPDAMPAWIVIENLEIRGGRLGNQFTGRNGVTPYADNAASIYIEKGQHVVIRGCHLTDCSNGLFCASQTSELLVEGNWIEGNGNDGSIFHHNAYTEASGITYQFNRFGPLRPAASGNNLKDRSAGTVIRYNWIEAGNRQLDLVESNAPALVTDPRYRTTFVYGNVLLEPGDVGNSQIVHYGGDGGTLADYRQGTLHFFQNTVVSRRSGNTTLVRLSSAGESADARNNILFVTAPGSRLALLESGGRLDVTNNWMKTGWVASHGGATGVVDHGQITGADPGFVAAPQDDFELLANSPCVGAGIPLHPAAVPDHVPGREYGVHQRERFRPNTTRDLGAFESGAPVTGVAARPLTLELSVRPNPARGSCEIRLVGAGPDLASAAPWLDVLDLQGRTVTRIAASSPGRWIVTRSERMHAGTYIVRVGALARRIVIL